MSSQIRRLYRELQTDGWRVASGFSTELEIAQDKILKSKSDPALQGSALSDWLQQHQPCLFGRIAAKWGLISYCFLTENDLQQEDEMVREKIQAARIEWSRQAFEGRKSAFVILAATPILANANPDEHLLAFSRRLCELYLLCEIKTSEIYMDELLLELPGPQRATWRWNVGVNFFASAGDGRWWHDHRIPGGVAFSMNSVGHLVKATVLAGKMSELETALGLSSDHAAARSKILSLPKALEMAMRTIDQAAVTSSGRATELLPLPADPKALSIYPCPVSLPGFLKNKNYCTYKGYYHTDQTIPREYFTPAVERPQFVSPHTLDFTYLFVDDVDNPDFRVTGEGRRVREYHAHIIGKESKSIGRAASASEIRKVTNS